MVVATFEIATAFEITADPDSVAIVETKCLNSIGEGIVPELLAHGIEKIEAVAVGSHPHRAALAEEHARDAVAPDGAGVARTVADISKVKGQGGLHVESFLEHRHPDVALPVLDDGVDFARGEVDAVGIEWVVDHNAGGRLIGIQAVAVAADIDFTRRRDKDTRHRELPQGTDLRERRHAATREIDTIVRCAGVDVALNITGNGANRQMTAHRKPLCQSALSVLAQQAAVLGVDPQTPEPVFRHPADIFQLAESTFRRTANVVTGFAGGLENAVARCTDKHLTIAPHDDVVDIGLDDLVLIVVDLISVELLSVKAEESFVGT